jgi:hypothetical protein
MKGLALALALALLALAACTTSDDYSAGPAQSYEPGTYGGPAASGTAVGVTGSQVGAGNNGIKTNGSNR